MLDVISAFALIATVVTVFAATVVGGALVAAYCTEMAIEKAGKRGEHDES